MLLRGVLFFRSSPGRLEQCGSSATPEWRRPSVTSRAPGHRYWRRDRQGSWHCGPSSAERLPGQSSCPHEARARNTGWLRGSHNCCTDSVTPSPYQSSAHSASVPSHVCLSPPAVALGRPGAARWGRGHGQAVEHAFVATARPVHEARNRTINDRFGNRPGNTRCSFHLRPRSATRLLLATCRHPTHKTRTASYHVTQLIGRFSSFRR